MLPEWEQESRAEPAILVTLVRQGAIKVVIKAATRLATMRVIRPAITETAKIALDEAELF